MCIYLKDLHFTFHFFHKSIMAILNQTTIKYLFPCTSLAFLQSDINIEHFMTPSLVYPKPQEPIPGRYKVCDLNSPCKKGCSFPVKTYRSTGFQLYIHVFHRINVGYIHLCEKTHKHQVNVGKYTIHRSYVYISCPRYSYK